MTMLNGAGVTEMSVSVGVLTVDGTRRMSRQFLVQIPAGTFFAGDGTVLPAATAWGYARVIWGEVELPTVIGVCDGHLLRMDRKDAEQTAVDAVPEPTDTANWNARRADAHYAAQTAARKTAKDAFDALIADLPQLYFGG